MSKFFEDWLESVQQMDEIVCVERQSSRENCAVRLTTCHCHQVTYWLLSSHDDNR